SGAPYPIYLQPSGVPPTITSVTPGGSGLTVNGSNFDSGIVVQIFSGTTLVIALGGSQLQSLTSTSFQIPPGLPSGSYNLVTVNPGNLASSSFGFTAP
ncbi:MAG TPA: IPT/TIG domain-containing protein, partial [Bryobacteraceae bacterium]|nr:IPT/TIG domain-containing protein [Bryobacteraceae bacterium]